jgi:ubiquinone/menaquinone biosynthesis C-methylase UbiE
MWEVEHAGGALQNFPSREQALFEAQQIGKSEGRHVVIEIDRHENGRLAD